MNKPGKKSGRSRSLRNQDEESQDSINPNQDFESHICYKCETTYHKENDKLIMCERCDKWVCLTCTEYSDEEYDFLSTISLPWFCEPCRIPTVEAAKSDNLIENRCKEYFQTIREELVQVRIQMDTKIGKVDSKLTQEIVELRKKVNDQEKNIETKIQGKLSDTAEVGIRELEDRDVRKANIVIFNAQESESDNSEERISHDKNYVQEMQKQMGIDVTVKAVLRLGARGAGDCPIKIKLKNRKLLLQEMKKKQAKSNKDQEDVKWVIRQGKVIKGRLVKKDGEERV